MEVILGALFLVALVLVLVKFARDHSRREKEALAVLGGIVHARQAQKEDGETRFS